MYSWEKYSFGKCSLENIVLKNVNDAFDKHLIDFLTFVAKFCCHDLRTLSADSLRLNSRIRRLCRF